MITVNEQNLEALMKESFDKHQNWLKVFKELKAESDKDETYNSLKTDFNSIFLFHLIRNKVDLEQFSQVIADIYENNEHFNIGQTLERFFYRRDCHINLANYSKLDKYNNNESIYDQMGYLFLDWDNKNKVGKRVILDKENLQYLLTILNETNDKSVGGLWYGYFHCFLDNFTNHIEQLKPLIDVALNNLALAKRKTGEYHGFMDNILRNLGKNSYEDELYKNESKELYNSLAKIVPNINDHISKTLIRRAGQKKEEDIEMSILNFCLKNEESIDIAQILNNLYQEKYSNFKHNNSEDKFVSVREYRNLTTIFDGSISFTFRNFNFEFNAEKIDIQKGYKENYIYLKLLEVKLENQQKIDISNETVNYVMNLFENKSSDKFDQLLSDASVFFDEDIMVKYLKKYMDYNEINNSLDSKTVAKSKKAKI